MRLAEDKAVILFDGVCNLCNASVNFIIDRDKKDHFRFAPLQSEIARELTGSGTSEAPESILLVEKGKIYRRSTAALRIARRLSGAWPLLYAFIIVPSPLRDLVYNVVAGNRYRWFGKQDSCRIPTPELKKKFLDYNPPQ